MLDFLKKPQNVTAVIVAGGSSQRYGKNKLLEDICGKPVIVRAMEAFENSDSVSDIVLVANPDFLELYRAVAFDNGIKKLVSVVPGGKNRHESVIRGIEAAPKSARFVAIHDAARPMVTADLIQRLCSAASRTNAVIPVSGVTGTVKSIRDGEIRTTLDREEIFIAETPQVFDRQLIYAALVKARDKGQVVTDDATALELIGTKPAYILNEKCNIKITRKEDLVIANAVWKEYRK